MPLVANNSSSRLAASIGAADTTISLQAGTGTLFPAPTGGEWFPLTLIAPDGTFEILRCTARSTDVLTVDRAQEGTAARAFSAGDRIELRLTAGALNAMLEAVRISATLTFTPVQQGGGSGQGSNKVYIGWDGSGLKAQVDSTDLGRFWTTANFNPANYLPLSGGTMSGNFTIQNGTPQINFYDTDWGWRYLHCNGGSIGFLTSGGGWACYSDNSGNFIATANIGAYSDRKHKRDIKTIEGGLEIVEALRGVSYTRKKDGKACIGVIAQEVQEVVPEVVGQSQDGLYVDYGNLVAPLIEAIKELAARVKNLEGR